MKLDWSRITWQQVAVFALVTSALTAAMLARAIDGTAFVAAMLGFLAPTTLPLFPKDPTK